MYFVARLIAQKSGGSGAGFGNALHGRSPIVETRGRCVLVDTGNGPMIDPSRSFLPDIFIRHAISRIAQACCSETNW